MGEQSQERKIGSYAPRTSSTYQSWTSRRSDGCSRSRPQQSAWCNTHPSPVKKIQTFTSKCSFNYVKHSTWTGWLKIKWGQGSFRSCYSGRLCNVFAPKIGRSHPTGQTCGSHRSDWCGQSPRNPMWTSPLDRSRRVDQNTYVERPNRSPDERDMTSPRFTRRMHRSDRCPSPVRPVPPRFRAKLRSPDRLGL
jgi:hypothetical protein